MPFGPKRVNGVDVDFDRVFREIIIPAAAAAGYEAVRGDNLALFGDAMAPVYESITNEELVIADITGPNPNVMYELGVRHTVRRSTTILIRCMEVAQGERPPFDINSLFVIGYHLDGSNLDWFVNKIKLAAEDASKQADSQVYDVVRRAQDKEKATIKGEPPARFQILPGREVWLYPGDILTCRDCQVWVNPENDAMEMARHYDRSISSTIRYAGAVKDGTRPVRDTIAIELGKATRRHRGGVRPRDVLVTGSGELRRTNGVEKIFHVAAVYGTPGLGYLPFEQSHLCVRNVLTELDAKHHPGLESVLFPLFGTGTGGADVEQVAPLLIHEAVTYLRTHPATRVRKVGFATHSKRHFDVCLDVLRRGGFERVGLPVAAQSGRGEAAPAGGGTMSGRPARYEEQDLRVAFDDVFTVVEAEVSWERPDGSRHDAVRRLSFERGDSAAAVVVDTERGVALFTQQFRYPAARRNSSDAFLLELPAGSVAEGESPEECMRRELEEELGYEVPVLEPISTFYVSPGGSSERIFLFYAAVSASQQTGAGGGDPDEDIRIVEKSLADIPQLLATGAIVDAKTLIGLTWLVQNRLS